MSFCAWSKGEIYKDHFSDGIYVCKKCDNELFDSQTKFKHDTPWPAFSQPVHSGSLKKIPQDKNTMKVECGKCKNGLGHEFLGEGPKAGQSRF